MLVTAGIVVSVILGLIILLIPIIIIPYVYVRKGYRLLSSISRKKGIRGITHRFALALARRGNLPWIVAVDLLEVGLPGPSHLLALQGLCPPENIVGKIRGWGFYEVLTILSGKGCSIPERIMEEAKIFHILAGQKSYLEILGFTPEKPPLILAYCHDSLIEVWAGGNEYSSRILPGRARERLIQTSHPELIGMALGAGIVASWGCSGGIDAIETLSIAYPEIPPSVEALKYHFGVEGPPSKVVGESFLTALSMLSQIGVLRELGLPEWITSAVHPGEGPSCNIDEGVIVITDSPKASCPTWSSRSPDIRLLDGVRDPRVKASIYSLAVRSGDWKSALKWSHLRVWGEEFKKTLARTLKPSKEPPTRGGFQIRPVDASLIRISKYRVVFNCLRPLSECASHANLRIKEKPSTKPIVHPLSPAFRNIWEAVKATERDWKSSRTLYIVPSRLSALITSRTLGIKPIIHPWNADHWDKDSSIISWEDLLSMPWVLSKPERIILIYPESYPGIPEKVADAKEWVLWLTHQYSPLSVSRLLYHLDVKIEGNNEIPETPPPSYHREWIAEEAEKIFKHSWKGYSLRPYQKKIITSIIEMTLSRPMQPVFTILPTGSGKSAIFQVAGVIARRLGLGGYTLVISPLIALMRDQVEGARRRGFKAERIDASITGRKRKLIYRKAAMGLIDFIYATPERFMEEGFNELIISFPPALVVLDEAHTLARWGPSFRPSYLHSTQILSDIRSTDKWPPIALFTATAPPDTIDEVLNSIGTRTGSIIQVNLSEDFYYDWPSEGALVFQGPIIRPEIEFKVKPASPGEERVEELARLVVKLAQWSSTIGEPWIGLIYTGYVRRARKEWENADYLAELLSMKTGINTISYHGQLSPSERRRRENSIYRASIEGPSTIVVATKAFGMGVDIPNIRWVIHFTPSESIEDYYQEVGRAGRDGRSAKAIVLYHPVDFEERLRMIRAQRLTPSQIATTYNTILSLWNKIREKTGGNPEIVIPRELLYADPINMKALNMLQRLGYLDYWALRAPIVAYRFKRGEDPSDYLPWYMDLGSRVIIGPDSNISNIAERIELTFYRCPRVNNNYRPVAIKAGSLIVSTGECREFVAMPTNMIDTVVVNMSLNRNHSIIEFFPPLEFSVIMRNMWIEEEKLEYLHKLLEESLRISRKSEKEADRIVKKGINEYFNSFNPLGRVKPPSSLGMKASCPKLQDCIDEIVDVARKVSRWIGPKAITLAVQEEDKASWIVKEASARLGGPFQGRWRGMYNRVVAASRRGGIGLMDYGFIIAVVKASGRRSVLIDRLDSYPYSSLFIYTVS